MPQFDFYTFSTEVFWTLIGFFFNYYFVLYFYLAPTSEVLKMRKLLKNGGNFSKKNKDLRYDYILSLIFKK